MANKSKKKGTAAETRIVKYLLSANIPAKRIALSGSNDKGDIEVEGASVMLEVKAGKQTQNPSRTLVSEWLEQTRTEQENGGWKKAWLVIARHGRSCTDYDCYSTDSGFCWLDQLKTRLQSK